MREEGVSKTLKSVGVLCSNSLCIHLGSFGPGLNSVRGPPQTSIDSSIPSML